MINVGIIGPFGFIADNLIQSFVGDDNIKLTLFGRRKKIENSLPYFQIDLNKLDQKSNYFKGLDVIYSLVSDLIPARE